MAPLRPGILVRRRGRHDSRGRGAGAGVVTSTAATSIAAILAGLPAIGGGVARGVHEQGQQNGP